ncbi:MAG: ABC transporter ATP-binding protein [Rhodanobacteraceae bacterium]
MNDAPFLSLTNIRAGYEGSEVLTGLSIEVNPGEVVALLGRNGMGKSTTVSVIAGTLGRNSGDIRIAGQDVSSSRPSTRYAAGLRVVRQDQPVFGQLSVTENLGLVGCRGTARAAAIFPFLANRGRQAAGTLSGGEQKLLAIARTAVEPGRLWVLDEPTEGLQPANVDRCAGLISEAAQRGIAVLLVEQHLEMAMSISARWYLLEKGQVVDSGRTTPESEAAIARHMAI